MGSHAFGGGFKTKSSDAVMHIADGYILAGRTGSLVDECVEIGNGRRFRVTGY